MPRRAQSGVRPAHWLGLAVLLVAVIGGGYALLHRGSDPLTGLSALDPTEYLESSTALSGNTYRVEGVIDDRLDNWRAVEGRLFSVQLSDAGGMNFVPVWVPSSFEVNVQRGQRYVFKVRVLETGVLEVIDLNKA